MLPKSIRNISDAVDYLRQTLAPKANAHVPFNDMESLFASIEVKNQK